MAVKNRVRKLERVIRTYITLATGILFLILLTVVYWQYSRKSDSYHDNFVNATANLATQMVDGDIHREIGITKDANSASYKLIQSKLNEIKDCSDDIESVYTWRLNEDNDLVFIVDAEPEEGSFLGDIYEAKVPVLTESYSTISEPIIEEEMTTDRWGTVKTVYSPILTSGGEIDGVIGIDISAETFSSDDQEFLNILIIIFIVAILLIIILTRLITGKLTRPFREFTEKVQKSIESGFEEISGDSHVDILAELYKGFNKAVISAKKNNQEIEDEVKSRTEEIEKINQFMIDRELKMKELKTEISQLKSKKHV